MNKQYDFKNAEFKKVIYILFFCLLFLLTKNESCNAQGLKFGISAMSSISGNGFGSEYSPGVFFIKGRKRLETGVMIQKRGLNVSGYRVNYAYTVFDGAILKDEGNHNLELFFFLDGIYHNNAKLGISQLRLENQVKKRGSTIKFDELRYKSAEGYTGFGLRIKITDHLKWANAIGIGGWGTLYGEKKLDREYQGFGIMLKTNLTFQF